MATDTFSIRLSEADRTTLEEAAQSQGKALGTFIRDIAQAEARRLMQDRSRAEGERVVAYLKTNPEAAAELEEYGTPSPIGDEDMLELKGGA